MTSIEKLALRDRTLAEIALLILADQLPPEQYAAFSAQFGIDKIDTEDYARLNILKNIFTTLAYHEADDHTVEGLNHIRLFIDHFRPRDKYAHLRP